MASERKTRRVGQCPILILDGKFDRVLFQLLHELAQQEGRTFKWFCPFGTVPRTYLFNPFDAFRNARPGECAQFILQALNLYSGDDHGRGFYYEMNKQVVEIAVYAGFGISVTGEWVTAIPGRNPGPVKSFTDLHLLLKHVVGQDKQKFRDAQHVISIVEGLARSDAMTALQASDPEHHALKHAIQLPEVIEDRDIVYGIFPAAEDPQLAGLHARMLLLSCKNACTQYLRKTGKPPNAVCFADDAAILFGMNFLSVLTQCREVLGLILCTQNAAQARLPGGFDLSPILDANTVVKMLFSVRDLEEKKQLSQNSGTVLYSDVEYSVTARNAALGRVGQEHAAADADGLVRLGIKHRPGPRLEIEDIEDANRDPNQCLIKVERNFGFGQFIGGFPGYIPWQMSEKEFLRRQTEWVAESVDEGTAALVELTMNRAVDMTVPAADPEDRMAMEQSLLELERELSGGQP